MPGISVFVFYLKFMFSRKLRFPKTWISSAMARDQGKVLPSLVRLSPALLTSLMVTVFVVGCQKLGWLEPLELRMFDALICLRSTAEPDPNLLIVAITEDDIQSQKQWHFDGSSFGGGFC